MEGGGHRIRAFRLEYWEKVLPSWVVWEVGALRTIVLDPVEAPNFVPSRCGTRAPWLFRLSIYERHVSSSG